MSDKLQDVVERFIAENATPYIDRKQADGEAIMGIDVDDLRAFLAQYVLCDVKHKAWVCTDYPHAEFVTTYREQMETAKRCGFDILPLYAPAKESK